MSLCRLWANLFLFWLKAGFVLAAKVAGNTSRAIICQAESFIWGCLHGQPKDLHMWCSLSWVMEEGCVVNQPPINITVCTCIPIGSITSVWSSLSATAYKLCMSWKHKHFQTTWQGFSGVSMYIDYAKLETALCSRSTYCQQTQFVSAWLCLDNLQRAAWNVW